MTLFMLACVLLIFLAIEMRINDMQKSVKEIKDSLKRSDDRLVNVEKSIIKEGKEQT